MLWIILFIGGVLSLISYVFIDRRNAKEEDFCGEQPWKHKENIDVSVLRQEMVEKNRSMAEKFKVDSKGRTPFK